MAVVLGACIDLYKYYFTEFQDPLTEGYPLLGSPLPVLIIIGLYAYFVLSWGPKFMFHRKPYDVSSVIIVYNTIQVLANLYVSFSVAYSVMQPDHSLMCQPITYDDFPMRRRLAFVIYIYFVLKIADLLDTVFFVLRKKNNQMSFLHIYHHSVMVVMVYLYNKFILGSHGVFVIGLNSFIHSIMYGYYLIVLLKPELKQSIWWKKYITQMQIIQFVMFIIYYAMPMVVKDCNVPLGLLFVPLTQNIFMLGLFGEFYIKSYLLKKSKSNDGRL